jgi:hypothetical protein
MLRSLVVLVVFSQLAVADTKPFKDLTADDKDRVMAARLLFGYGLAVKEDTAAKTATVEFDAKGVEGYGVLDEAKLRHFIVAYYRDALRDVMRSGDYGVDGSIYDTNWGSVSRQGGGGWALAEPAARRDMCLDIARKIKDAYFQKWTTDWCHYVAAYDATFSLVEFRGKKVTWNPDREYEGTLTLGAKLWQGDEATLDPVITVPGVDGFTSAQRMRARLWLVNANPDNSEFHPSVVKMKAKLAEYSAKQEAAVAALEKKQAGANGGVAVFASEPFDGWKPVEAKTAGLDCEKVWWKIYGPKKWAKADVNYEWTVTVDKNECQSGIYDDGMPAVFAWGPVFTATKGDCSEAVEGMGKHTIVVQLWRLIHKKTGEYQVKSDGNGAKISAVEEASRGGVVATGKVVCETKSDNMMVRFKQAQTP